jgi:hypothetical protein
VLSDKYIKGQRVRQREKTSGVKENYVCYCPKTKLINEIEQKHRFNMIYYLVWNNYD